MLTYLNESKTAVVVLHEIYGLATSRQQTYIKAIAFKNSF